MIRELILFVIAFAVIRVFMIFVLSGLLARFAVPRILPEFLLVILLVNPSNRTKDHIRTLAEIARLLSSSELRAALVRSESAAHVLDTIRAAESVAT